MYGSWSLLIRVLHETFTVIVKAHAVLNQLDASAVPPDEVLQFSQPGFCSFSNSAEGRCLQPLTRETCQGMHNVLTRTMHVTKCDFWY